MSAADVITMAERRGVTLTVYAARIMASPAVKLTPELRDKIKTNKAALLSYLALAQPRDEAEFADPSDPCAKRSEKLEICSPYQVPKVPKPPYGTYGTNQGRHISEKTRVIHASAEPDSPCLACGSGQWWQGVDGWRCRRCEPMTAEDARTATTLTLDCHEPVTRPLPPDLSGKLATACEGLSITPAQLRRELEENGDLPDVASGELSAHGLRLVAAHLAESIPDPKTSEALALLAENPGTTHALTSDDESDPDHVLLTLAIRNKATCQLRIARDQYDGLKVLELLNEEANL